MRKFSVLLVYILCIPLVMAQSQDFVKLFSTLPDSFGMLVAVDDYRAMRKNPFRRKIVDPIIEGAPGKFAKSTRQYSKLTSKIDALEKAAGFRFIGENLEPLIGKRCAIAFYNPGEAEFVYATTMPAFPKSLEKPRSWYEKHSTGKITYWTARRPGERGFGAFLWTDGVLIITNSERLLPKILALATGTDDHSIARDSTTLRAVKYSGFTGDDRDAVVVLNMEILRDDPYYHRYYQGNHSADSLLLRTAFCFKFNGKWANIQRVSIPEKTNPPEEIIPGGFSNLVPENCLVYEEFPISSSREAVEKLPFGELIPFFDNPKLTIERAGVCWFVWENEDKSGILPMVFIKSYNTKKFVQLLREKIPEKFEDPTVPGYAVHWERQGNYHILVDQVGLEMGVGYAVQNGVVVITPFPELAPKVGSGKADFEFPQKECVFFGYYRTRQLGRALREHINYLIDHKYLTSYSAKKLWKNFGEPIAFDVLNEIDHIRRYEYFDESVSIWRTITEIKLK